LRNFITSENRLLNRFLSVMKWILLRTAFMAFGARRDVAGALTEMGRSLPALGNDAEAGHVWHEAFQIATETQGAHVRLEALV
jgi:hypothetical protein